MTEEVEEMGIVDDRVNLREPFISTTRQSSTGGSVFLERMLFVVISTEPVLERSYAIELGGRCGNMAWMTWDINHGL